MSLHKKGIKLDTILQDLNMNVVAYTLKFWFLELFCKNTIFLEIPEKHGSSYYTQ